MKPFASRRLLAPLSAIVLLQSSLVARAADKPAASAAVQETWIGIYMNGKKMGYSLSRTEPSTFRGKPVTKMLSTSVAKLEMFGKSVTQNSETTTFAGPDHKPIYQDYKIESNGSVMTLKADYSPGKIVVTMNSGTGASKKVIPVPAGTNLVADSETATRGKTLAIGQKSTYHYLNPLTISLDKTDVTVDAEEKVTYQGKPSTVFRVTATSPFGKMLSWETPKGDLLKAEMSFGPASMVMFQEPRNIALDMASKAPAFEIVGAAASSGYTPPSDFALATAVTTDRPIENARNATDLRLEIRGIEDKSLMLSDKRQETAPLDSDAKAWSMKISAQRFDVKKSVSLPIAETSVQKEIQSAPFLEAEDPEIQRIAKTLRGSETNAYRVAGKIRQWVFSNMKADFSIGVPRSCTEVLKKRRGVCRDCATLFAGIARAAGIPTRVTGGIVYMDGKFFYHAWAECWVGEWVPFDATTNNDFVDATHIKFAQGDVTDMYKVAGIIGKLQIKVLPD